MWPTERKAARFFTAVTRLFQLNVAAPDAAELRALQHDFFDMLRPCYDKRHVKLDIVNRMAIWA